MIPKSLKMIPNHQGKSLKINDLLVLLKTDILYKFVITACTIVNFMYSTSWPKKLKFKIPNSTWLGLVWLGLGLVGLGLDWVWFGWVWVGFGLVWVWFGLGLVWLGWVWIWFGLVGFGFGLVWLGFGLAWVWFGLCLVRV